jgi:outer membrane protein assembly factor BamB
MDSTTPLFVGTANRVCAIDRASGRMLWNVTLNDKLFKMGSDFVNLEFDGEALFAATLGELYCLDPRTGAIRWKISLENARTNPVTFASSPSANRDAAMSKQRMDNP